MDNFLVVNSSKKLFPSCKKEILAFSSEYSLIFAISLKLSLSNKRLVREFPLDMTILPGQSFASNLSSSSKLSTLARCLRGKIGPKLGNVSRSLSRMVERNRKGSFLIQNGNGDVLHFVGSSWMSGKRGPRLFLSLIFESEIFPLRNHFYTLVWKNLSITR